MSFKDPSNQKSQSYNYYWQKKVTDTTRQHLDMFKQVGIPHMHVFM